MPAAVGMYANGHGVLLYSHAGSPCAGIVNTIEVPLVEARFRYSLDPKYTVLPVAVKPSPVMTICVPTGPEEGDTAEIDIICCDAVVPQFDVPEPLPTVAPIPVTHESGMAVGCTGIWKLGHIWNSCAAASYDACTSAHDATVPRLR